MGGLELLTQAIEDERQDAKTAKVRRRESAWPGGGFAIEGFEKVAWASRPCHFE
jgi:hypothetical protein